MSPFHRHGLVVFTVQSTNNSLTVSMVLHIERIDFILQKKCTRARAQVFVVDFEEIYRCMHNGHIQQRYVNMKVTVVNVIT